MIHQSAGLRGERLKPIVPIGLLAAIVLGLMAAGCGSNGSSSQQCLVTASGDQVCGKAAAAWCEATDAVRTNSIDSGYLPTNEADTLKQTQSDCQTIEASYVGSTGSTASAGTSDSTGSSTSPTPTSQIQLGQPCIDPDGNSGYGQHTNGNTGPVICVSGAVPTFTAPTPPAPTGPNNLPFFNSNNLPSWHGGGPVPSAWSLCGITHVEEVTNDGCGTLVLLPPFLKLWRETGSPPQHVTDSNGNNYTCALTSYRDVWKCNNASAEIWVEFLARRP